MKDLIERLRSTRNWLKEGDGSWKDHTNKYDRAPFEAADALEQQSAVIEQMREALHRCTKFTQEDYDAIELQPCPEVLNKVRADAVRKFGVAYGREYKEAIILPFTEHYARRIEKGEA